MRRLVLTASLFITGNLLATDLVTLKSGDVFTGEVMALSDGIITLDSPHSDTPLKVRNENLQRLKFGETSTDELPKNSQVLNLRNGDTMPGQIVGLSDTHVSFQTWFAGQLEIPRNQIESLFFGVTTQTTIYRGPKDLVDWDQGNESRWEFDEGRLRSRDRGTIGKDFKLPANFIFSTRFTWINSPNLSIHLCSDSITSAGEAGSNSYLLYANSQGIQIRRVTPQENGRPQYKTLITYDAPLRDIKEQSVEIEVRIDRSGRMLQLSINGEALAPGFDPEAPPTGTHIVFESLSSGRRDIQIEDIHIQEWDTKTQRFRAEPRADEKSDTLTVDDGDRFSGKIVSYDPTSEDKGFVVTSPQSQQPITIPQENCSVMYFSKQESTPESKGEYRLDLRSGGGLTLSEIKLGAQNLEANHPWLGQMTLDRRIMSSISKGQTQ
ncbi:MAG: hypothetical protein QNL33_01460 [Akkermansiaceae bacterium]